MRWRKAAALAALIASSGSANGAWAASEPATPELDARIDASVRAFMQQERVPGLAFALVDRTRLLKLGLYGLANIDSGRPVTADTRFGIGSITKSMTALALLAAQDRGVFDPHVPITRYVPEFRPQSRWRPITGYDLLTHTSGLPDPTTYGRAQVALTPNIATGYAPGEHWWYSNLGYVTLGTALERIEARPWIEIVADRVFSPLAMQQSEPAYTQANRASAAVGYDYAFDDRPSPRTHPIASVGWIEADDPDGFVLSTAGDMANYARFLLGDGTYAGRRILSPNAFAAFTHAVVDAGEPGVPGLYARYGFGLAEHSLDGHRVIGHTGGTNQFSACLEADVDAGLAALALTNHGAMGPRPCAVVEYALRAARAQREARALPDALGVESAPLVPHADAYAKTFRARDGRTLTFVDHGATLALRTADGHELPADPRGGDSFFVDTPALVLSTIDFVRGRRGQIDELFYCNDWYRTASYHGPAGDLVPAELAPFMGHYRLYGDSSNVRVFVRHGRLWLEGGGELWPAGNGAFGVGERWSPERYRFDTLSGGAQQRLLVSGIPLIRTFTP